MFSITATNQEGQIIGYDDFFNTLIKSAEKNGLEFVDDCGHISVRIKGDKSGNYVRIDDVLRDNNYIVEKLFY